MRSPSHGRHERDCLLKQASYTAIAVRLAIGDSPAVGDPSQATESASRHAWFLLVPEELQEIINRYGSQMTSAMAAPMKLCKECFEQFDTAGHALGIQPLSVGGMAKRYKSGSLDPVLS